MSKAIYLASVAAATDIPFIQTLPGIASAIPGSAAASAAPPWDEAHDEEEDSEDSGWNSEPDLP